MLLTIAEAAAQLGVPKASLRSAAERHGYLVRIGRALRLDPSALPELIAKCQGKPPDPDSIGEGKAERGLSATRAARMSVPARATSASLKSR